MQRAVDSLIDGLKNVEGIQAVFVFFDHDIPSVWVVLTEADVELEERCVTVFIEILRNYPNFCCDFSMYHPDEFSIDLIPSDLDYVYYNTIDWEAEIVRRAGNNE